MANLKAAQRDRDTESGRESSKLIQLDNSPLPPAEELERINQISPDLVTFIANELKTQYEFNRSVVIKRDATVRHLSISGLWLGWVLAMTAIGSSVYVICSGHTIAGCFLGASSLAAVVAVIVNAGVNQRRADQSANGNEPVPKNGNR